jgi:uncharacterized protein YndB with AHSA1/START domain
MPSVPIDTPSDTEIVFTRIFDAPRELVFETHTTCEHMSRWWGPRRYELSFCDIDFREGGAWRMVHRGADGAEFGFHGEFREIVRPQRITWTFEFEGAPGHVSLQTVVFEEHDGKTTLTSTATYDSKEERDAVLESGMTEGAAETWDRLDEYLEELRVRG